ncbi:MAG: hypothetical protein IT349_01200 [Candidatus Eisenbacteria bacterium]|nr:hypothetical protein [Candidatus Eisenbacteria bacterium]
MRITRFGRALRLDSIDLRGPVAAMASAALAAMALSSCQQDDLLKPGDIEVNILTANYISDEAFADNPIELDGEALEREWGGPLDTDLPYHHIRVSREDGSGDPGEPAYVSMKCFYTDTDIYFLVRWADDEADELKDATYYIGPDLAADTTGAYIGCDNRQFLATDQVWTRNFNDGKPNDEDRFSIAFDVDNAGDGLGSFREQGCLTACHLERSPAFGTVSTGRLDVWEWLATRTNLARDLYNRFENPSAPIHGIPAYLEDYTADGVTGLLPDPGSPVWRENWEDDHHYPLQVYRLADDLPFTNDNCRNRFGAPCIKNNGVPVFYPWREDGNRFIPDFSCADSVNQAVLPAGREERPWSPGDAVTGYYFTYPSGSRADVHGKGVFEPELGRWTLEVARKLDTRDAANDIIFSAEGGEEVTFAIAISDNAGSVHWGSGPQVLRFAPKVARLARSGKGAQ